MPRPNKLTHLKITVILPSQQIIIILFLNKVKKLKIKQTKQTYIYMFYLHCMIKENVQIKKCNDSSYILEVFTTWMIKETFRVLKYGYTHQF